MAFTAEQRSSIRFFLGYPDVFLFTNSRLENAMDLVGTRPEAQARVELLLSHLDKVYGAQTGDPAQIDGAAQRAGIKSVESADDKIEFGDSGGSKGGSSSSVLNTSKDFGRQCAAALSSYLGVELANDVFGTTGYRGDVWMSKNHISRGPRSMLMGD